MSPVDIKDVPCINTNEEGIENFTKSDSLHPEKQNDMIAEEVCPRALNEADAEEKEAATLVLIENIRSLEKETAFTAKETGIVGNKGSENCPESDSLCPKERGDIKHKKNQCNPIIINKPHRSQKIRKKQLISKWVS